MDKNELKEYIQSIHNKVSIAVSFALLSSKPNYISTNQYAEEIQEKVFQSWIKGRKTAVFDDKILEFQRNRIFYQLSSLLLLPPEISNASKNSEDAIEIPNVCDFIWENECISSTESESENDCAGSVQNNISFVEAMVQLKFAVESSKTIPVEKFHSIIQGKPSALSLSKKLSESKGLGCRFQFSEDSGYGDSAPILPSTIPSSTFRWVTHSIKTDGVLSRCVDKLLFVAGSRLRSAPYQKFSAWQGSVLEQLTSTFRNVSYHPLCASALVSFVISFLDEIWSSQLTSQLAKWDYQIAILGDFCCSRYIVELVVDFLMEKFEELGEKLSAEDIYSEEKLGELYIVEKAPLFLEFARRVLKGWSDKPNVSTSTVFMAVTDLWQKEAEKTGEKQESPPPRERWALVCEGLVLASTNLFPLLSHQAWDLLVLLKSDY